ncbi:unnamed protein product [Schistosoma turkestanicum]|nr:unnamed protein product [Schistosoma turkestanicum]
MALRLIKRFSSILYFIITIGFRIEEGIKKSALCSDSETVSTEFVENSKSSFRSPVKSDLPTDDQENKENNGITSTPISNSEESCVLNRTYELSSPVMCCKDDTVQNPVKQYPESKKSITTKRPLNVKTVPDFKKIHAKATSKTESIMAYASRHHLINNPRPPFASPPFVNNHNKVSNLLNDKSKISFTNLSSRKSNLQKKKSTTPVNDKRTALKRNSNSNSFKRCNKPVLLSSLSSNNQKINTNVNNHHQPQQSNNSSATNSLSRKATINIPADSAFARRKAYDSKCNQARRLSRSSSSSSLRISKRLSTTTTTTPKSTSLLQQDARTPKPLFVNIHRNKMGLSNIYKQEDGSTSGQQL